jgi:hypothetical protein
MTSQLDELVLAAAALVRTRKANCEGCAWWPPMSIIWRDADGVRQWWMQEDLGPSEPCSVCGRTPITDARVYRLRPSGWLEADSEPNVSRELLHAAARRWVDLFIAVVNRSDAQPTSPSRETDDLDSYNYEVKFWARWRGAPERVPPGVMRALLERDPWWRSRCGSFQCSASVPLCSGSARQGGH